MKSHNIYKSIVICEAAVLLAVSVINLCRAYLQEQKSYGFAIWSDTELTESDVAEFQNISGICRFEPVSSVMVTIKLEEYTLETKLAGVDLETFPLKWKEAGETVVLGNTAALFFGENMFQMFSDKNGRSPGKRQIKSWMEHYQELPVTIADESGNIKKAKVFGILKNPEDTVCMDKKQMEEIFEESSQIMGGYMEVYGYRNMKKTKDALEGGGFRAM